MLQLTFIDKATGVTYPDAVHRPTIGLLDLLTLEVLLIVKIYPTIERATLFPQTPFARELICVLPADVQQYFVPLADSQRPISIRTAIDTFLQTIDPTAEGTKYPNCRVNYSQAITL